MPAVGQLQKVNSAVGVNAGLGQILQTKDEVSLGVMGSLVSWFDPDPVRARDGLVYDRGDVTMTKTWFSNGPVRLANGINGKPTLSINADFTFNSSDEVIPSDSDFTVTMVVKPVGSTMLQFFCGSQGVPYLALGREQADRPIAYRGAGQIFLFPAAIAAGEVALVQLAYQYAPEGSKVRVSKNGVFQQPYEDYAGTIPPLTRFDWQIGAASGAGSPCTAEIGQMTIHSQNLADPTNAADQARVVAYFNKLAGL